MSTDRPALVDAVEEAAGKPALSHRDLGVMPDAVQLSLLKREQGEIDAEGVRQIRGRGRPPNSRNKRNQKTAQLIVQKFGDPLDGLGNFSVMPLEDAVQMVRLADDVGRADELDRVEQLAERLISRLRADDNQTSATQLARSLMKWMARKQISAIDVLGLQLRIGQDLMTYVHGRQPVSVEVREKTDAVLIIPGINAPMGASPEQIKAAVDRGGLDAIDFDNMRILAAPEEAEFVEVEEGAGDD